MTATRPELLSCALYAKRASAGRWKPARHLMALDKAVIDCIDGRDRARILVIEMPPRHGKSEFCSKWLPSWYLGTHPNRKVMLTSYSADLSRTFGRAARDHLEQYGERFGVRVRQDVKSAAEWQLAGMDGGMMTAGVGGSLTGFGANLAIIDDPLKNAEEALSDRIREKQVEWFKSTLWTRIEPGGLLLIIQTRWHKEDLAGWILRHARDELGVPVRHLSFPAIATHDADPLGREPGDALWPERWPLEQLRLKQQMSAGYWWDALYQQQPGVYGNAEWPPEYFDPHIWTAPEDWPDRFEVGVVSVDPSKGKDARRGDYSAITFVGLAREKLWVAASVERRPVERIVADALRMSEQYAASCIGVEGNAFQDLLAPELSRVGAEMGVVPPQIVTFQNMVNKDIRISRLGPLFAQKMLRIKQDAGGELLIKQCKDWPHGDHDDGPDGLEMGVRLLREQLAHDATQHEGEDRWEV